MSKHRLRRGKIKIKEENQIRSIMEDSATKEPCKTQMKTQKQFCVVRSRNEWVREKHKSCMGNLIRMGKINRANIPDCRETIFNFRR